MGRLDGPVPAIEGEQAFRRCGLRTQAGDAVSRLAAPFMRLWKSRNEASVYLMWSPPWVGSIFGRFRRVETLLASVAPQVRIPTFYPGGCRQGCAESVPPIPLAAGAAFRRRDPSLARRISAREQPGHTPPGPAPAASGRAGTVRSRCQASLAPVGTRPVPENRHSAMSSLRASATIITRRMRPRAPAVRSSNHLLSALSG